MFEISLYYCNSLLLLASTLTVAQPIWERLRKYALPRWRPGTPGNRSFDGFGPVPP
jgi:hypothetical protein